MKIVCILLTMVLIALGAHHVVLYLDYQTLSAQLTQQQADFDNRLQHERKSYQQKIDSLQEFIAFGQNNHSPTINSPSDTSGFTGNNNISKDKSTANPLDQFVALQEENLQRMMEKKYSLLMSRLRLSGLAQTELRELLEQREKIMNNSNIGYYASQTEIEQVLEQQRQGLMEIDRQIDQLLESPEDKETYQLLKESAYEQGQMNKFFDQVEGEAPIPQDKRDALLISKLEHRQEFSKQMASFAMDIQDFKGEGKTLFMEKTHEALNVYKDNFLNSARDKLTQQQFETLREREQKQFEEMWKSLKAGLEYMQ